MEILVAIVVVFALLAIFFRGRTIRCARRGRLLRASGSCVSWVASLAIAAVAVLLLLLFSITVMVGSQRKALFLKLNFALLHPTCSGHA